MFITFEGIVTIGSMEWSMAFRVFQRGDRKTFYSKGRSPIVMLV